MKNQLSSYPSPEEMSTLTAAAHRARARQMKLLLLKGVRAVKSLTARVTAEPVGKRVSHA